MDYEMLVEESATAAEAAITTTEAATTTTTEAVAATTEAETAVTTAEAEWEINKWRQWLKKVAIAFLLILIISLAAGFILTRGNNYNNKNNNNNNATNIDQHKNQNKTIEICKSQQCNKTASRISSQMNFNADPCKDFHEFVCGNFTKEFILPENMLEYSSLTAEAELIYLQGKAIIEEVNETDWSIVKKAKQYYRSCMDEKRLEELGLDPMKEKLKLFGGWPVIEGNQWNGDDYKWYKSVIEMGRNGFETGFIVSLTIGTKALDSTSRILILGSPTFGLDYKYLSKGWSGAEVQYYYSFMVAVAILFGAEPEKARVEMKAALLFEIALSEAFPVLSTDKYYDVYNTQGISLSYSWDNYVNDMFSVMNLNTGSMLSYYSFKSHLDDTSQLLQNTDARVIANYLGWRVTESALKRLNKDAWDISQIFRSGIELPRWKWCLNEAGFNTYTDNNFRIPLASIYVTKFVDADLMLDIETLIKSLKETFHEDLLQKSWLDSYTKDGAVKKLLNMIKFVAYPPQFLDEENVENYFQGLNISETDYSGNFNRLTLWDKTFKFGRLDEKVMRYSWIDHSLVMVANAYNNILTNDVQFPAGLFLGEFYDKDLPKYFNYGAIGSIIGHEMLHGFDNIGRQYDFEGNQNDWWYGGSSAMFDHKADCLADQYSHFYSPQVNLYMDGRRTLAENIADNGGLNQAYLTYDKWLNANGGEEPRLPGLDHFTPRQLFFLSFGQNWCAKYSDDALKALIESGTHSPEEFRIKGPIMNSQHFATVFNCKEGSKMNPVNKCQIW